jgi:hypothetical protein
MSNDEKLNNSSSQESSKNTIPPWFKAVAIVALIWNLMGVMAFIAQMMMTPEQLATLSKAEQDLFIATPGWANVAFAFAVFGGAIGCLGLMIKKLWAKTFFIISLVGVTIQMFHSFFVSNSFEVFGPGGMIMPVSVIIIAVFLLWMSVKAESQKWLT